MDRCGRIVRTLLRYTRQEPTEKQACNINDVAEQSVELARPYGESHGAELRLDLDPAVPLVPMNPLEIELVLVNVIRNAVEAGGGSVVIAIRTLRTEGGVRVEVRDNGRGMNDEQLAHVFDPLYTTRRQAGGSGLGMSIALGIVQGHEGHMEVRSQPGKGTTVTIDLPLPAGATRPKQIRTHRGDAMVTATPTVYIVDDDPQVCESLSLMVRSVGLEPRRIRRPRRFSTTTTTRPSSPKCMVLDVRMPGLSGLGLQQMLAAQNRRMPIIMISGCADIPMAVQAMSGGALDFLEKPFSRRAMLTRIQEAIDRDANARRQSARKAELAARVEKLSSRQREVLDLLVAGKHSEADRRRTWHRRKNRRQTPRRRARKNAGRQRRRACPADGRWATASRASTPCVPTGTKRVIRLAATRFCTALSLGRCGCGGLCATLLPGSSGLSRWKAACGHPRRASTPGGVLRGASAGARRGNAIGRNNIHLPSPAPPNEIPRNANGAVTVPFPRA